MTYAQKTATEIELSKIKLDLQVEQSRNTRLRAVNAELIRQHDRKCEAYQIAIDELRLYKADNEQYKAENQSLKSELASYKRAEIKVGMIRQTEGKR